jgi:non-ribosomal peptide synthetase component F
MHRQDGSFQVVCVYEDLQLLSLNQSPIPGVSVARFEIADSSAKFDLSILVQQLPAGRAKVKMQYNTDIFPPSYIERKCGHFLALTQSVIESPDQPISKLHMLTAQERQQVLYDWNDQKACPIPETAGVCFHELFRCVARQFPHNTAVVDPSANVTMTYQDVDDMSNRLANYLVGRGVLIESYVVLAMTRSWYYIVCLLGVLKAGGCFIPIEYEHIRSKLAYVVDEALVVLTISHTTYREEIEHTQTSGLHIEYFDEILKSLSFESTTAPSVLVNPSNLAYAIFTSGSTGKPKVW